MGVHRRPKFIFQQPANPSAGSTPQDGIPLANQFLRFTMSTRKTIEPRASGKGYTGRGRGAKATPLIGTRGERRQKRRSYMAATVWKGYLSFGLVSFPVRLFSAARAEAVHFHMLHKKDLSRVKEVWYCAQEDKPIERSDIVKGYEVKKGEYVTVDDEELK